MLEMMKESQTLPIRVKAWMGVMVLTFVAHFAFLNSTAHIYSLVAFFGTLAVAAPLAFNATGNINALAASHFIVWPMALAIGFREIVLFGLPSLDAAGLVLLAGYGVFIVSLILDYRILMQELTIAPRSIPSNSQFNQTKGAH